MRNKKLAKAEVMSSQIKSSSRPIAMGDGRTISSSVAGGERVMLLVVPLAEKIGSGEKVGCSPNVS